MSQIIGTIGVAGVVIMGVFGFLILCTPLLILGIYSSNIRRENILNNINTLLEDQE